MQTQEIPKSQKHFINTSNSFAIILSFIAIIIAGFSLIPFISFQLNPVKELPQLSVSFSWLNTSPEVIEKEASVKLEDILNTLSNLKKITSTSSNGEGNIQLYFHHGINIDEKRFEVASLIRQIYSQLPKEVSYPFISVYNDAEDGSYFSNPILSFVLNGNETSFKLQKYATEKIKTRLSLIDGISKVEVYGGNLMTWNIVCDPQLLNAFSVNYFDVRKSVANYFEQQSIGIASIKSSDTLPTDYNIHLTLKNSSADTINWGMIPIKKTDNHLIYLKDIATIHYEEVKTRTLYRLNGSNAISILIFPTKGENNLRLANKVKIEVEKIKANLPNRFSLLKQFDSTDYVKYELNKIIYRALYALAFLLFFLFVIYRSIKYLFFIFTSLIATIAISLFFIYFFKIDIRVFSLAGVMTAICVVVGNSAIIIYHYNKYQNFKSLLGILGTTLTVIISLSIAFLLPDELKYNLTDFACIIIVVFISSAIVSLLMLPALLIKFSLTKKSRIINFFFKKIKFNLSLLYSRILTLAYNYKKIWMIIFIFSFGIPLFLLPTKLETETWYSNFYNKTFGSNFYKNNLKSFIDEFSGGTLRLFIQKVSAYSFHTQQGRTTLYIEIQLPYGSTIEHINSVFRKFEILLKRYKEIQQFTCTAYNATSGLIIINFNEKSEKSTFPAQLKGELASKMFSIGGANCLISGVGDGLTNYASAEQVPTFQVTMKGYNYEELKRQAQSFKAKLETSPRIKNININKKIGLFSRDLYEYKIDLDNYKLSNANIPISDLYHYLLKQSVDAHPEIQVSINEKKEQVLITQKGSSNYDLWRFYNSPVIFNNDSRIFKLSDFATIIKQRVNSAIHKENQQYICNVSFDYLGTIKFGMAYLKKNMAEMKSELPIGYSIENKSHFSSPVEKIKEQYVYILLVIILIYLLAAIIFESLLQPFAVILTIPLSFIGVFITFSYFDINFDEGGFAAFLLLSGIITGFAIFIIQDYNNILIMTPIKNKKVAYLKAFKNKSTPIVLTMTAICIGLLPFLFANQKDFFWFSLAAGTIGGLIFSIVIIPIYLPLYLNLQIRKSKYS